jgi:hypothetical protein
MVRAPSIAEAGQHRPAVWYCQFIVKAYHASIESDHALEVDDPARGSMMDFIERIFGIAPDSGDGSLELLLFLIPLALIAALALRRARRTRDR